MSTKQKVKGRLKEVRSGLEVEDDSFSYSCPSREDLPQEVINILNLRESNEVDLPATEEQTEQQTEEQTEQQTEEQTEEQTEQQTEDQGENLIKAFAAIYLLPILAVTMFFTIWDFAEITLYRPWSFSIVFMFISVFAFAGFIDMSIESIKRAIETLRKDKFPKISVICMLIMSICIGIISGTALHLQVGQGLVEKVRRVSKMENESYEPIEQKKEQRREQRREQRTVPTRPRR